MNMTGKIQQVLSLVTCLLILASLAILKQGRLAGHDFGAAAGTPAVAAGSVSAGRGAVGGVPEGALRTMADGSVVVNTTDIGGDISGFAGRVPLEITVKDGIVRNIKALKNDESPAFFDKASALFGRWTGKSVPEAAAAEVDAVSGATFSSKAIIGNVQRGLQLVQRAASVSGGAPSDASLSGGSSAMSAKDIAGLVVVLLAATLPLFVRSRRYRIVQTVANVVVLGFWCGSFVSYTSMVGFMAGGWQGWAFAATGVMLVTAFVYPLFGRPSYYCANVCPFGGLQQLAGSMLRFKLRMSPGAVRRLDVVRQVLWALLMLFVWSGVWSSWIDCEPFTAFLFGSASWAAIGIAVAFVALSFVVPRPYCRFVCPVGTLLKYSQRQS